MTTASARLVTRDFALASVAHFLHASAIHAYLHVPGFLEELGATEVEIGGVAAVAAGAAIAARPFVGRLMDLRGRRLMIVAAGGLHVIVTGLYLTVTEFGAWITIVRALHGVATAMMFSALFTYAADIVPEGRRTEGLAIFGVFGLLPLAVGSLTGDFVLARLEYDELFWITLGLAALGLVFSLPLREGSGVYEAPPGGRGFFAAAFQRDLIPVWFMGTVFATALSAVFVFLKTFVLATGVGSVGLFMTVYAVAASLLRVFFGWVPDRVGPKRALYPAIVVLAIGLLVLARAESVVEVAAAGAMAGLGHGFTFPILAGLVVSRANAGDRGSALSLFTAVFDGGMLVGGPVFGAIIESASYPAMFATAAAVAVTGTAVFAVLDRGH